MVTVWVVTEFVSLQNTNIRRQELQFYLIIYCLETIKKFIKKFKVKFLPLFEISYFLFLFLNISFVSWLITFVLGISA